MNKVNVLFIMLQMQMGGAERLIYNLVSKMDRDLFNPSVAWFFGDRILNEFKDLNIPYYYVPKGKRLDLSAMKKIGNIIKNNDIHIVNAHHFMSLVYAFYGCKIKNHSKLIYTEHSEWEIENISWKWRRIGDYLLKRSDGAVGVNMAVSDQIRNKFKTNDSITFTIQNGVDLDEFIPQSDKAMLRRKLGFGSNENIIGIVANFRKIKNHIFLLKAFKELIENHKDHKNPMKLLLIGQGFANDPENSEQEIRHFINDNGLSKNVLLLGYRTNIPDLLCIMDIFCLTSFKEGLPVSLIEAMAAGLPVVGTDVEGIRDVIVPNRNGFLVQVDDIVGLKKILYDLLYYDSLRNKLGQESRLLAREKYSLAQCMKQYQDLFLSILGINESRSASSPI